MIIIKLGLKIIKTNIRAMKFIALFILYLTNFSFCSNQILSNINDSSIWIKYKEIESVDKIDSLLNFLDLNKFYYLLIKYT